jgi:hypothetical protein
MSLHHYDPDFDDSLFPAYANYISGFDTQVEAYEAAPISPVQGLQPIYYTNSMPSRSALYARAPDVSFEDWTLNSGFGNGFPVLDLRSPAHDPDVVTLNAPQLVHPASRPPRISRLPTLAARAPAQVSSAEVTRQKLLDASKQQRPMLAAPVASSSPHQFRRKLKQQAEPESSPERRRLPARQAMYSSLLRSSSATDIDSQIGSVPPAGRPQVLLQSPAPSPAQSKLPPIPMYQAPPIWPNNSTPQSGAHVTSHLSTDDVVQSGIIQPGDLLSNPRYASLDASVRLRADAEITQLWTAVRQHPDSEVRKQSFLRIQGLSGFAQFRTEQAAQEQVQSRTHAQVPTTHVPTAQESYAQPSIWSDSHEDQAQAPQLQHQAPSPQYPPQLQPHPTPHLSPPFESSARTTALSAGERARIDAQLPKFASILKFINMSFPNATAQSEQAKARANCETFFSSFSAEGQAYLRRAVQNLQTQQTARQPDHIVVVQQPRCPPAQTMQQPQYPLTPPQYPSAPATQKPQQSLQPHISSAASISPALRTHIQAHLPEFISTMRCLEDPDSTLVNRHRAREFQARFGSSLPVEGYRYIQELMMRMRGPGTGLEMGSGEEERRRTAWAVRSKEREMDAN